MKVIVDHAAELALAYPYLIAINIGPAGSENRRLFVAVAISDKEAIAIAPHDGITLPSLIGTRIDISDSHPLTPYSGDVTLSN